MSTAARFPPGKRNVPYLAPSTPVRLSPFLLQMLMHILESTLMPQVSVYSESTRECAILSENRYNDHERKIGLAPAPEIYNITYVAALSANRSVQV